jgi:hypothetical protein
MGDIGDDVHVVELVPPESPLDEEHQQSLLYSSDLELGEITKAVFGAKKRFGSHENTIREMRIDSRGITIGKPRKDFQGVLRGIPLLVDRDQTGLLEGH